ncbi:MAG TPA: pyridoxal-phosphate dependent enzyme [Chloroflexota bacterium]|nr:pyridoxal-phosphate dependent enzyme [Chloroflexota bacterium]
MAAITPIALDDIRAARERIAPYAIRTPLLRLNVEGPRIYLKLENLQPIGSFKVRGAANAMALAGPEALARGVWTASAGNMAQGVAWVARAMGVRCTVLVPDTAPQAKLLAIERLGAGIVKVPFDTWWQVMLGEQYGGMEGYLVHPVADPDVIAGNGTIGLEILEDLPEVDTIVVPFGGGGLSSGIASAARSIKPETKVFAAEVATAAPLAPSLAAGSPQTVDYEPSFVDGIGGKSMLPAMWPLVRDLLDGSIVISLQQVADALRLLVERNHIVAEGAGAASVAAALSGDAEDGTIVCVVSGGNIDTSKLVRILSGETP